MSKIFIVEDDSQISRLYKIFLEFAGYEVIGTANNGERAIKMFKSLPEKPDYILMDYRMPIKNGLETAKILLELDTNSRIIFISADINIKDKGLSLGAKNFVKKPFALEKLIESIEVALKCPFLSI